MRTTNVTTTAQRTMVINGKQHVVTVKVCPTRHAYRKGCITQWRPLGRNVGRVAATGKGCQPH